MISSNELRFRSKVASQVSKVPAQIEFSTGSAKAFTPTTRPWLCAAGSCPTGARYRHFDITPETGPLDVLAGRDVLMVVDAENWRFSAHQLGYSIDIAKLTGILMKTCSSLARYAVFSAENDSPLWRSWDQRLRRAGYRVLVNPVELVWTHEGNKREANADAALLFTAGHIIGHSRAEVICVGSGDGHLAHSLAKALAVINRTCGTKDRQVVTLSLAGSTSGRLRANNNPYIDANLEIGRDALVPLPQRSGKVLRPRSGNVPFRA